MSNYSYAANVCIADEYDSLPFNMPYKHNEVRHSEISDSDIEEKNKWIVKMCNRINIDPQEVNNKNFTNFYDLAMWFWTNHYDTAEDIYAEQINKYCDKWVDELYEKFKDEGYDRDAIQSSMSIWLEDFFDHGFIWGLDSGSIFDAKSWDDVAIFDTTSIEMFYDLLRGDY